MAKSNLFGVGLTMLPFGVYSGVFRRYYVIADRLVTDNMRNKTWIYYLKKLLFTGIVLAPSVIVLGLCVHFKANMNVFVNMLVGCALPCWSIGYCIFGGFVE